MDKQTWEKECQSFEIDFHRKENYRWDPDQFWPAWEKHFSEWCGLSKDSFDSQICLDIGCGSVPAIDYFEAAVKYYFDPLIDKYIHIEQVSQYWDAQHLRHSISSPAEVYWQLFEKSASFINCWNVLDHCYDWRAVLQNITSYAKSGCMMCLSTVNNECSPVVEDVVFTGNRAGEGGAVVFYMDVSGGTYNARFEDVTFQYNAATGDGGAMSISGGSVGYNGTNNIMLSDVAFIQNTAGNDGGGLFDDTRDGISNLKMKNATFIGNTATRYGGGLRAYFHLGAENNQYIANSVFNGNSATSGGGMYSEHGGSSINTDSLILVNVVFSGNQASLHGGALYYSNNQVGSGDPSFINVTFASNVADDAGGADEGGAIRAILSIQTELHNCILWGNTATTGAQVYATGTPPVFYYSVIQDSIPGTDGGSNSTSDPLFLQSPSAGDGDWTTLADNSYGDLHLQTTPTASTGIDSGSNSALPADIADLDDDGNTAEQIPYDLDEELRINNGTVDRGAYEG